MTKIPDFSNLKVPALADALVINDRSDTTHSAAGTTKHILPGDLLGTPGDVRLYGADPYENSPINSSSAAFQAAVDSGHPVIVPPGDYYFDVEVVITRPTTILMAGGVKALRTGWDNGDLQGPFWSKNSVKGDQARIWTDQNINFFNIQAEMVYGYGGHFDRQSIVNDTHAALYYPAIGTRPSDGNPAGWGGGWLDFFVTGNYDELIAGTNLGRGVFCEFTGTTVDNGYWTHMHWRYECRGLDYGFYANARDATYDHWANTFVIEIDCQATHTAIYNDAANGCRYLSRHQSDNCFPDQASSLAQASIMGTTGGHDCTGCRFFDFGKGEQNGFWHNHYSFGDIGNNCLIDENASVNAWGKRQIGNMHSAPRSRLNIPIGYMPRLRNRHHDRAVFISELHDHIYPMVKAGSFTIAAYQGAGSPNHNFESMVRDSVTEGITPSTDVTINNPTSLFNYVGTLACELFWNSTAQARGDYVEIVIDGGYLTQTDFVNFCYDNLDNSTPDGLHLVINRTDVSPIDTKDNVYDNDPPSGETFNATSFYKFDNLVGENAQQIILRIIGCRVADEGMKIHEIVGARDTLAEQSPFLNVGGGPMYGLLNMTAGKLSLPTVTSAELEDITDPVNTGSAKRAGLEYWNTTTTQPVYASGDTDGATWRDATGSVVHTPV